MQSSEVAADAAAWMAATSLPWGTRLHWRVRQAFCFYPAANDCFCGVLHFFIVPKVDWAGCRVV